MRTFVALSSKEQHIFEALDPSEAKHWIINHLDCSQEWTLAEIINPTK
jgi:hypothetical protein